MNIAYIIKFQVFNKAPWWTKDVFNVHLIIYSCGNI